MRIMIYHASKFGNGAQVAEEMLRVMAERGHEVEMRHVREARPKEVPKADLYVFGSPTRLGKPIRSMRKFAKKVALPAGTRYAVFATHGEATPNKKTGKMPTDEEIQRYRRTIPILDETLKEKGFVKVADKIFFVAFANDMKGVLKEGWQGDVESFTSAILGHP